MPILALSQTLWLSLLPLLAALRIKNQFFFQLALFMVVVGGALFGFATLLLIVVTLMRATANPEENPDRVWHLKQQQRTCGKIMLISALTCVLGFPTCLMAL